MAKLTISMVIFHSYESHTVTRRYQPHQIPFNHHFPMVFLWFSEFPMVFLWFSPFSHTPLRIQVGARAPSRRLGVAAPQRPADGAGGVAADGDPATWSR